MYEQKAGRRAPIAPSASLFAFCRARARKTRRLCRANISARAEQTKKPQDLSVLRHFLVRWKGLEPPAY